MKLIVTAVPGSGKTTVLDYVKRKVPAAKIVHEGDMVFELAVKRFKLKNKDELRKKLSITQQRLLQSIVAKKIAAMKDKILLIDSHLSIKTPEGYLPGLPEKAIHEIKPDVIIVLEFNPKDIRKRRMKDKSRHRDVESIEEISEHQKINHEFAFAAAMHVQAAVEIISFMRRQIIPYSNAWFAARKIAKIIKKMEKQN
jgi:adenylate kinase